MQKDELSDEFITLVYRVKRSDIVRLANDFHPQAEKSSASEVCVNGAWVLPTHRTDDEHRVCVDN